MITSSIIKRIFSTINSPKSIVWTQCEHNLFKNFIKRACEPCSILDFDHTYYGFNDVDIIVCNNRMMYLEKCLELSFYLHCPVLIVDHSPKPALITDKISNDFSISPIYQIALSNDIYNSWGKIHNTIMDYSIESKENLESWRNLIFQLTISNFKINEKITTDGI